MSIDGFFMIKATNSYAIGRNSLRIVFGSQTGKRSYTAGIDYYRRLGCYWIVVCGSL